MRIQTVMLSALALVLEAVVGGPASAQEPLSFDIGALVATSVDGVSDEEVASAAIERAPALSSVEAATAGVVAFRDQTRVGVYPSLNLEAGYTRLSRTPDNPLEFGGAVIDNPFEQVLDRTHFRASLRFPVTRAVLAVLPGLEAAEHSIRAAELREQAVRREIEIQSRLGWLEYVRLLAHRTVAEDAIVQLEALRSDVGALVDRELRPAADLWEVDAALAQARLEATRVEGAIESARRSVSRVSGLDIPAGAAVGASTFRPLEQQTRDPGEAYRLALDTRPELLALREAIGAMDARRRAAASDRYPSVDLVASADLANPNDRYVPPVDRFEESWALSLVAAWSPNTFRAATHADRQLASEQTRLEADLASVEDQLYVEVNDALLAVETAEAAIGAAAVGVDAAGVALDAATRRNAAGLGAAREVLDAELALRRAQSALVDAHLQRRMAVIRVNWSIGISL